MSRRALTTWMLRHQELNRLLSTRHSMLTRPEPGRRMLQALGLAPDDAERDVRPRRLVRATQVFGPRPMTLGADMPWTDVAAVDEHAAAVYQTNASIDHADLAEPQRSELVERPDVAHSASEIPSLPETKTPEARPEVGVSAATHASDHDERPVVEQRARVIAAATAEAAVAAK